LAESALREEVGLAPASRGVMPDMENASNGKKLMQMAEDTRDMLEDEDSGGINAREVGLKFRESIPFGRRENDCRDPINERDMRLNSRDSNIKGDIERKEQVSGLKDAMRLIDEGDSKGSLKKPNGSSVYVGQWDTLKQKMIWGTTGIEEVENIQNNMAQHFTDVEAVPFKSQAPATATRHSEMTGTKRGAHWKMTRTKTISKHSVWKRKGRANEGEDTSTGGEQMQ
jgi:hypothetical protein